MVNINRFHDAQNVTELMYQVVGAGSVCWTNDTGGNLFADDTVFDDKAARETADAGIERLIELGWA